MRDTQWPTFLGIDVPRSGTTWLYELLKSHPGVWVPRKRREVYYFDKHFEKGLDWYSQFFPERTNEFERIGEVSPKYLYCKQSKIKYMKRNFPGLKKFILILRDPVDRLYSHYIFRKKQKGVESSFSKFAEDYKNIKRLGLYYKHISKWLKYYDESNFLMLQTEKDLTEPQVTKNKLSSFLNISKSFPKEAGNKKKNEKYAPVFENAYRTAVEIRNIFHKMDIYWPSVLARKLGVKYWFGHKKVDDKIDIETKKNLYRYYEDDFKKLQSKMDIEIKHWDINS